MARYLIDKSMRIILSIILIIIAGISRGQNIAAQSDVLTDNVSVDKIRTAQLYREGWNLSYPVLKLKSDEKLVLHFDLMGDQPEGYYYSFIHCDKDWQESDVFVNDYLEGYEENPFENYKSSFNTTVSYYHYSLSFPNERIRLTLSGNYVIIVYLPGRRDEPVLTKRFIITEDAVRIDVNVHRPLMTKHNNTHQQVDFNVNYSGLNINDPYRNVYAFILQNGRWENAKTNLKPDFHGNNELKYSSLSDKNIFPGGNEYRYFDIKSIRYKTEYVRSVDFAAPFYNISLQPSENREFKPYFYWKDFNGKYFIAFQEGQNPDIDADYVYVYFSLPSEEEVKGGSIYVNGGLNNWKLNRDNLMEYNTVRRQYECAILLKQGWYNYEYLALKDGEESAAPGLFEGSHYETENDYMILIYYRNPRDRYDRVLGTAVQNTLNRLSD